MTIKFYKSNEPFGYLNNFKKARMFIYDRWWNNVEAAYQSQKTYDPSEANAIWSAKTPREARDLGQKVKVRPIWDHVKYDVMYECVLAKFVQHHDLRELLLATGDQEIIEDNSNDLNSNDVYWACGKDGQGKNNLGKILMEVRKILKN